MSENDTSSVLGVSIKDGKYMLYQKLHAIQQQDSDPANATNQSEQSDSETIDEAFSRSASANDNKPAKPTILTLPTEIRLMIYANVFTSITENALSRASSYPLPPLLRANRVFRNESLAEWGSHLERVVGAHKKVQLYNQMQRKVLVQRARDHLVSGLGNTIKLGAQLAGNAGQSKVLVKRVDKLRLLQAHQMLAESGEVLGSGGSGARWRDGGV